MAEETFSRKLAAVLSVDAVGYSRLMQQNDVQTVRTIKQCREIISQQVVAHAGRVVDSPGDNLLAEFSSVIDAVKCALEIQQALDAFNRNEVKAEDMHFRIGVNMGDIIADEDRIYGDGINIAARLERLAEDGGICISGSTYEQVKKQTHLWLLLYRRTFRKEYPGPGSCVSHLAGRSGGSVPDIR